MAMSQLQLDLPDLNLLNFTNCAHLIELNLYYGSSRVVDFDSLFNSITHLSSLNTLRLGYIVEVKSLKYLVRLINLRVLIIDLRYYSKLSS